MDLVWDLRYWEEKGHSSFGAFDGTIGSELVEGQLLQSNGSFSDPTEQLDKTVKDLSCL